VGHLGGGQPFGQRGLVCSLQRRAQLSQIDAKGA
jgi:hypothetical protein